MVPGYKESAIGKLDTCAAMSIAHEKYPTGIMPRRNYGRHSVHLKGIGGHDNHMLTSAGNLIIEKPNSKRIGMLCDVYNRPISSYDKVFLIGMRGLWIRRIDLQKNMGHTLENNALPLQFLTESKRKLAAILAAMPTTSKEEY